MSPALLILLGGALMLTALAIVFVGRRREQKAARLISARLAGMPTVAKPNEEEAQVERRHASIAAHLPRWFQVCFARADIEPTWVHIIVPGGAVVGVCAVLFWLFGLLAAAVALPLLVCAILMAFQMMARRRMDTFVEEMPALFDVIKHLMLAGNSLQQGLVRGIEASGPSIQRYLRALGRRVQNGAPVADSIMWVAHRLDVPELYIFGSAVETNTRYGGRMANTLGNLAQIVRDGAKVRRELSAASAETRLSSLVLTLLPLGCAALIAITNPGYVSFFVHTEQGQHMAMFAIAMQGAGMLVMRRILRLDF